MPISIKTSLASLSLALSFVMGCGAEAERPVRSVLPPIPGVETGDEPTLSTPVVHHVFGMPADEGTVVTIPYSIISIAGSTQGATDILVEGARTGTQKVLPDNTFCVDLTSLPPAQYDLHLTGYSGSEFSPSVSVSVKIDPDAPPPDPVFTEEVETCRGFSPTACDGLNCGGTVDPSFCFDDAYDIGGETQQNDTYDLALTPPQDTDLALTICPGDDDYFIVEAQAGEQIVLQVSLGYTSPTLQLELLGPDNRLQPILTETLDSTSLQTITHTVGASQGGEHRVHVSGNSNDLNDYSLKISVDGA